MENNNLIYQLVKSIKCPVCRNEIGLKKMKFRGSFEEKVFLSFQCGDHSSPVNIMLVINALSGKKRQITIDDYLDIKNQLSKL